MGRCGNHFSGGGGRGVKSTPYDSNDRMVQHITGLATAEVLAFVYIWEEAQVGLVSRSWLPLVRSSEGFVLLPSLLAHGHLQDEALESSSKPGQGSIRF